MSNTATSTLNINVSFQTAPFRDRTGQRGRPQKHPQIAFDLSGAPKSLGEFGEKKVRLAAVAKLRETLGVDAKVPCTEHPKDNTMWILKTECGRNDYMITITDAE